MRLMGRLCTVKEERKYEGCIYGGRTGKSLVPEKSRARVCIAAEILGASELQCLPLVMGQSLGHGQWMAGQ